MRYKINAGLFVLFVLFISVCISNLANFLGTDRQIAQRLLETSENNLEWKDRRKKLEIGNGTDHLMWFVQVNILNKQRILTVEQKSMESLPNNTSRAMTITMTMQILQPSVLIPKWLVLTKNTIHPKTAPSFPLLTMELYCITVSN